MLKWAVGAALAIGAGAGEAPAAPDEFAQLVVREQIIVRVRSRELARPSAAPPLWKEGKGVKCVPTRAILGASLSSRNSVDLILRDRRRIRASLDSNCPALDYYHGFYVTPNADGQICANRDNIRSRMGGQCGIDRFRHLEAAATD